MLAFTVVKCYHIKQIEFLTNQEDSSMYAFDEIKKADSEIADAETEFASGTDRIGELGK